jgi:hypothetical protein
MIRSVRVEAERVHVVELVRPLRTRHDDVTEVPLDH